MTSQLASGINTERTLMPILEWKDDWEEMSDERFRTRYKIHVEREHKMSRTMKIHLSVKTVDFLSR